jgi:hypothetical protein
VPAETQTAILTAVEASGLEVVPVDAAEALLLDAGVPPDQATAIAADYGASELDGLRNALGAVALFAVLGLWFTRRLPGSVGLVPPAEADEDAKGATETPVRTDV